MAALYEQAYAETTAEIKKLLQKYSQAASDCAPDNSVDEYGHHIDAKTELKEILEDLASRPELIEMDEVKSVLSDCGIEIDVRFNEAGGKCVNVHVNMGE
jgi:hypothetical protein